MQKPLNLRLSAVVALILVGITSSSAAAQEHNMPKGEKVTLTNVQVIDLHCYTAGGMKGDMHKECNVACAKAGVPLGLLSEDGKVYVPVSKSPMTSQKKFNEKLIGHAEQFVTVKGTLFKSGGVYGIEIQEVVAS